MVFKNWLTLNPSYEKLQEAISSLRKGERFINSTIRNFKKKQFTPNEITAQICLYKVGNKNIDSKFNLGLVLIGY